MSEKEKLGPECGLNLLDLLNQMGFGLMPDAMFLISVPEMRDAKPRLQVVSAIHKPQDKKLNEGVEPNDFVDAFLQKRPELLDGATVEVIEDKTTRKDGSVTERKKVTISPRRRVPGNCRECYVEQMDR